MSDSCWFSAEDFEVAEFDPNGYISQHSGAVPLTIILQRLQQHVDTIRVDLIDVINADYPLFIGMAEKLGGVEGAAMQIEAPMLKLKEALAELQGRYLSELTSLKHCLHQQSQVHHTKTMLELLQDATAVMGKVESLTADLPATSSPASLERAAALAAQIERIASEVSRLAFYMTKGNAIPVIQSLAPRVTAVTLRLSDAISATLNSTLQTSSPEADAASSSCIHACSLVNRMELAHSAMQDVLIRPALDRAASAAAADTEAAALSSPNHHTGCPPLALPAFLRRARAELEPQISRIKGMVAQHPDLATTFDVLGVCTLSQLHSSIKANVPGAFSPADPDAFHRNYSSAMSFLSWLEEHAATEGALQLLQQSAECLAFRKSWNLAVYFSLRFQEIAGAFDEQLQEAPVVGSSQSGLVYQQSNALLHALGRCRDPIVTFSAVYDRFLKLQMQSILRYGGWLREASPGQAVPVSAPGQGTTMSQWAEAASPEDLVTLLADSHNLAGKLCTGEIAAIQAQLRSDTSQAVLDKLKQGVLAASAIMLEGTAGIEEHIVQRMLAMSASWKRRVLSIAATYRMTSRPPPSKPSHYVASLLEGPMAVRDAPHWRLLPAAVQQALLVKIVEAIIGVLQSAAMELLDTMAKTQASLSKLGRVRNSPAAGPDGGLSDIQKTQEQLRIDILQFGRNIEILLQHPATKLGVFEELLRVAKGFLQQGMGQARSEATSVAILQPDSPAPGVDSFADSSAKEPVQAFDAQQNGSST